MLGHVSERKDLFFLLMVLVVYIIMKIILIIQTPDLVEFTAGKNYAYS